MMFSEEGSVISVRLIYQTTSSVEEITCVIPEGIPEMKNKRMIILTNAQKLKHTHTHNLMGYFKAVAC